MVSQKDLKILSYLAMLAEKQKSATIEELDVYKRQIRNGTFPYDWN